MKIEGTEGLVIRYFDFGEADRIYTFYTLRFGKIRGIIKGIRKSRKRLRVDLLFRMRIFFSRKKRLTTITGCDLIDPHLSFYGNIQKTFYGFYFAELVDRVTPDEEPHASFYELFCFVLAKLDKGGLELSTLARIFEIRLMALVGYQPYLDGCSVCHRDIRPSPFYSFNLVQGGLVCRKCRERNKKGIIRVAPGTVNFLRQAQLFELEKIGRLHLVQPLKKEVEELLQRYIQIQLNVRIRSYRFLSLV